jgi:hypothetical protein
MPKVRTSGARTRGRGPFLPRQQWQLTSSDRRRRQRLLHSPPTLVSILHGDGGSLLLRINSGGSILHGYLHRWRPPRPPCARPPPTPRLHPPWQRNHPAHDLDPASRPRLGDPILTRWPRSGPDEPRSELRIFLFLKINFSYRSTPTGTKYAWFFISCNSYRVH